MGKDLKSLETKAENGDVTAQIELGHMYLNGEKDVTPDLRRRSSGIVKLPSRKTQKGNTSLDTCTNMSMAGGNQVAGK